MRIALFGSTGGTGLWVLREGLARGHEFRCLVRRPEAFPGDMFSDSADRLTLVTGDTDDRSAIANVLDTSEAVIITLGNARRQANTELSRGTGHILEAMTAAGVRRVLAVTSLGCGDSLQQVPGFVFRELIVKRLAREIWADKNRQEAAVRASGLDFTLMRPGGLTDADSTVSWRALTADHPLEKSERMISRRSVASALLDSLEQGTLVGKAVTLVSG